MTPDALRGKVLRREVVARRPHLGRTFGAEIVLVGLEGLHQHGGVGVIVVDQAVEVVGTDRDRQFRPPVVGIANKRDAPARVDGGHLVGAGAKRWLQCRLANVALLPRGVLALPPMLRKHIELPKNVGQLTVARRIERKTDDPFAGRLGLRDVAVVAAEERVDFLQRVEGPDDVVDRHRLAVLPARPRVEPILRPGEVGGIPHRLGQLRVAGGDVQLVQRGREQRLVG
jgi:hypothetical protein